MSPFRGTVSARAATLGFAAGLRTFTPLAALSLQPQRSRRLRRYLVVAALIELGLDKLPRTPSRLGAAPLGGRLLSGATAAVVAEGPRAAPAGMLSALIGAHVGARVRRRAAVDMGWPDYVAAGLEDALALTLATVAAQPRRPAPTSRSRPAVVPVQ